MNRSTIKSKILIHCLAIGIFAIYFSRTNAIAQSCAFTVYSEEVVIDQSLEWVSELRVPEKIDLGELKKLLTQIPVKELSNYVESIKSKFLANDWNDYFIYQVLKKGIRSMFPNISERSELIVSYKMLELMGFAEMLVQDGNELQIMVRSDFDAARGCMVELNGESFHLLDGTSNECTGNVRVLDNNSSLEKSFVMALLSFPKFTNPQLIRQNREFTFMKDRYHVQYDIDSNRIAMIEDCPTMQNESYLQVPIADLTLSQIEKSLFPMGIKGMSRVGSAELLLAFVRKAFFYEEDSVSNGIDHYSYTADQTLFFNSSDCEDRTALFFQLQKHFVGFPMIVLEFPNHYTLAISTSKSDPAGIQYGGKIYSIADPSWPQEGSVIGKWPSNLVGQPYQIVFAWEPNK